MLYHMDGLTLQSLIAWVVNESCERLHSESEQIDYATCLVDTLEAMPNDEARALVALGWERCVATLITRWQVQALTYCDADYVRRMVEADD